MCRNRQMVFFIYRRGIGGNDNRCGFVKDVSNVDPVVSVADFITDISLVFILVRISSFFMSVKDTDKCRSDHSIGLDGLWDWVVV